MKEIRIGNTVEQCVERSDYPPERIKQILGNETIAVLGYGVQGRGQSLNMRDNGLSVIIGLREGSKGWQQAQEDGWVPGKTLFPLEEAANPAVNRSISSRSSWRTGSRRTSSSLVSAAHPLARA